MEKITVSGKELIDYTLYLWGDNYDDQGIDEDDVLNLLFKGNVGWFNETDENKKEFFMNEFDVENVKIVSPDQFEIEYDEECWGPDWYK